MKVGMRCAVLLVVVVNGNLDSKSSVVLKLFGYSRRCRKGIP